jgi:hypothetical protein
MGHLKWGGYPYKVLGALVWKMKAAGDPIVFTTT